jgi:hypothetical protein
MIFDSARAVTSQSGVVVTNPRARLFGGGGFLLIGLTGWIAALAPGGGAWRTVPILLGVISTACGIRFCRAFSLAVENDLVELRFPFHTKRLSTELVDRCEPKIGSDGLISVRAYPLFLLKDGSDIPFSSVQWPADDIDEPARVCEALNQAIRS